MTLVGLIALFGATSQAQSGGPEIRRRVEDAMKRAATFYRERVSVRGGYVYYTSLDLKQRWGEGKATPSQIWVQPPGTPTVGMAYVDAFRATADPYYLGASRETAGALVAGQLQSGGWTNHIDFDPGGRRAGKYRKGKGGRWNVSSLDDNQSQSALLCLMRTDEALRFKDGPIHEATTFGLAALLKAQFPNGGFPQVWRGPVERRAVQRARYPDRDWRTEGRIKNYWDEYTLNDGLAGDVAEVLVEAGRIYKEDRFSEALEKLGDFLILAQMPAPQPAWCQQYDREMLPIWARKFEPPAVTGWESQDVMETLIRIYRQTGKKKYLKPIPRALGYLRKSLLPNGKLARFYELRSNRPLYMTRSYELTYDASRVPGHYGWEVESRLEEIGKALADAKAGRGRGEKRPSESEVREIADALDKEGRWITVHDGRRLVGQPKFPEGFSYVGSETFSRNIRILSGFLARTKAPSRPR